MTACAAFVVLTAGAQAANSPCPTWCANFKCDGSSWCQHGEVPAPCSGCAEQKTKRKGPYFEYTIPPYVGAGNVFEARSQCEKQGGRLASVANEEENQALLSVILHYKRDRATISAERAGGTWRWQGRSQNWAYENWAAGQPDSANEHCVEMWTTGEWNDVPCDSGPRAYLCEVAVPAMDFTFPCSAGVTKAIGRQAKCRYDVSALEWDEKKDIHWGDARDRCRALGGGAQMAEPRTPEQTQYLASIIRQHGSESLWIGLTKRWDGFFWEGDGSRLTEEDSHWSITEPNGVPGDCVEMWEDGTWNDRACDIGKVVACERPVD